MDLHSQIILYISIGQFLKSEILPFGDKNMEHLVLTEFIESTLSKHFSEPPPPTPEPYPAPDPQPQPTPEPVPEPSPEPEPDPKPEPYQ